MEKTFPPEAVDAGTQASACLGESFVDILRAVVRRLVADQLAELALHLVEHSYQMVIDASPIRENLRPWQILTSDLGAALENIDAACAEKAFALADEIRAMVTAIARNPAEQLAVGASSRRVLLVLEALGGRAELAEVRTRSGHSATHFSNSLNPLRAHGFADIETSAGDRRSRLLVLTGAGRAALAAQNARPREPQHYAGYRKPVRAVEGTYTPLAIHEPIN